MNFTERERLAVLLRKAAALTITESEFWPELKTFSERVKEPIVEVASESATHYWGNFHQRNILLIPVKPDNGQLEQGRNRLALIAQALEGDWALDELEARLKEI